MKQSSLFDTQKIFRTLMHSMASPGERFDFDEMSNDNPVIFCICETLIDNEVTFSVVGQKDNEHHINAIRVLTGAEYVDPQDADFVIVYGGSSGNILPDLHMGTLEYPEDGATVIYVVDDISASDGVSLRMSGPGIKEPFDTLIGNVEKEEFENLRLINSGFPLGIDIMICDNKRVLSIPRTTVIDFAVKE